MTSLTRSPAHIIENNDSTKADAGSAPSASETTQSTTTRVLATEQELVLSTAAAISAPAKTRQRRLAATLVAAICHIRIRLPEPRPIYPRRDASYFETARMSRAMDHL